MVLVEDVSNNSDSSPTRNERGDGSSSSSNAPPPPPPPPPPSTSILNQLLERKIDTILLLSRLATIFFTLLFILPINRSESQIYYSKALLSSIATSFLRLRQRLPNFQFSRDFLFNLFREDSAHYLLYAFLFLSSSPMTIILIPVTTYAILHACSFLSQILNDFPAIRQICTRVTDHHVQLLRFIALNEIFLMPILIVSIFIVRSNFLLIFMYYRFLTLRYTSSRNPYTRSSFSELRLMIENFSSRPGFPSFIRRISSNMISFINRLAPTSA